MSEQTESFAVNEHVMELEAMIKGPVDVEGLAHKIHAKQTFLIKYMLNQIKGLVIAKRVDRETVAAQQGIISDLRACIVRLEEARLPERTTKLEVQQTEFTSLPPWLKISIKHFSKVGPIFIILIIIYIDMVSKGYSLSNLFIKIFG